jgi:hypothetical protein
MKKKKDPNVYPPGLDADRARAIAAYYDALKDVDLSDDSASLSNPHASTWVEVPNDVLEKVHELISKSKRSA